jgi:uncharacterized protein
MSQFDFKREMQAAHDRHLIEVKTVYFRAVAHGGKHEMELFLRSGIGVNDADSDGRTALHNATKSGNAENVRSLLENGADPNARDDEELTPVLLASLQGDAAAIAHLHKAGANLNDTTPKSLMSPLHLAIRGLHTEAVRQLLERGAPLEAKNAQELTPFLMAIQESQEEYAMMLVAAGSDIHAKCGKSLKRQGALHLAATAGMTGLIALLLDKGADPTETNDEGDTPLMIIERQNRYTPVKDFTLLCGLLNTRGVCGLSHRPGANAPTAGVTSRPEPS